MRKIIRYSLVMGCMFSASAGMAQEEPAVFSNGELAIAAGMVIGQHEDRYYRHIRLLAQPDGSLRLTAAERRNLALLEELELHVSYGDQTQVELQASGFTSTPCTALEPVTLRRIDNTFHVLIAEAPLAEGQVCAQVLAPFDVTVELDATGLPPGEYQVLVNNEPMEFTLEDIFAAFSKPVPTVKRQSESPAYAHGVMHLPAVLLLDQAQPTLLAPVELQAEEAGTFVMMDSYEYPKARVESISTTAVLRPGEDAEVHINGFLASACLDLQPVVVSRFGPDFHLIVTQTPYPDNARCTQALVPFLVTATLDTADLPEGEYGIHVHGLHIAFEVSSD